MLTVLSVALVGASVAAKRHRVDAALEDSRLVATTAVVSLVGDE